MKTALWRELVYNFIVVNSFVALFIMATGDRVFDIPQSHASTLEVVDLPPTPFAVAKKCRPPQNALKWSKKPLCEGQDSQAHRNYQLDLN